MAKEAPTEFLRNGSYG